jgi:CTP:molybdopterin cytidylyltransferase MocA
VPAIFPKAKYDDLMALQGDRGAKHILKTVDSELQTLSLAEAAIDIDRPEDLEALSATL